MYIKMSQYMVRNVGICVLFLSSQDGEKQINRVGYHQGISKYVANYVITDIRSLGGLFVGTTD